MRIGTVGFRPYIYNANAISSNSLSRISSIGDDLTSGKTDFSALEEAQKNKNPLRKGETLSFGDVLERQMWTGRQKASRFLKSSEGGESLQETGEVSDSPEREEMSGSVKEAEENLFRRQRAIEAYQMNMTA